MKKLLSVTLFVIPFIVCSQNKYTLSGYVKDSLSGETLIGSTISVAGLSKGITSNSYGFFSISLNAGTYTFISSNVGYITQLKKINLTSDVQFNFEMPPKITTEQAIIISSKKRDANVKNAQMGKLDLSINQIKSIPAFLGEVDVLKTIQLLPGKKIKK